MADAEVVNTCDVGSGVVTGAFRISFAVEAGRSLTQRLYHWTYPEHDRSRLAVGTHLGVTLIGLRVGHGMPLLDSEDVLDTVRILPVQDLSDMCAVLGD